MIRLLNDFLPDASAPESVTAVEGIKFPAPFMVVTEDDISGLLRPREDFSHKGTYGHALIIAGAAETMGAALLAAAGCVNAGAGLTTAAVPESGLMALNASLPEVMYADKSTFKDPKAFDRYTAIAIGPGLLGGQLSTTNLDIIESLYHQRQAVIADADMLGYLSGHKSVLQVVARGGILTPHMKEFDQLFGAHTSWWARLETAIAKAKKLKTVIVLKNQFTFIIDTDGQVYINPTGNPAMAQGGMGDVLTGILAAFVAQGYSPVHAALIACYVHGRSGDDLAEAHYSIRASLIAKQLPKTIKLLIK